MKLKYRLAGIYLLTAVLPVIVLFTFSYGQMKHILIERDTKSIQNFVNQAGAGIDAQLEVYNNLSNYITFNETIASGQTTAQAGRTFHNRFYSRS